VNGYLLVRSQGKPYGLPVARVLEVGDATEVLPVPRKHGAVRGLTPMRGRLVPLVHLGSFLSGADAPPLAAEERAVRTVVLVELGAKVKGSGKQIAFEVDDADAVVREQPLPVPRGQGSAGTLAVGGVSSAMPWASGVADQGAGKVEGAGGELVPIIDLDALGDHI
jgi:chemotaxis signal transduction protein